jgi:hypothetical protein
LSVSLLSPLAFSASISSLCPLASVCFFSLYQAHSFCAHLVSADSAACLDGAGALTRPIIRQGSSPRCSGLCDCEQQLLNMAICACACLPPLASLAYCKFRILASSTPAAASRPGKDLRAIRIGHGIGGAAWGLS